MLILEYHSAGYQGNVMQFQLMHFNFLTRNMISPLTVYEHSIAFISMTYYKNLLILTHSNLLNTIKVLTYNLSKMLHL